MKKNQRLFAILFAVLMLLTFSACKNSDNKDKDTTAPTTAAYKGKVMMATTTSTDDTGLLDALKPLFRSQTGWDLEWTAKGTGAAIKLGEDGEVDVLLVHAKSSEEQFVADGYGVGRKDVMYNDFVIIGPEDGKIQTTNDITSVFKQIADEKLIFVSRGDDSGTHKKELEIWSGLEIDPEKNSNYVSAGDGMSATITMAIEKNGYCLTDRGTWLATEDKGNYTIVCEGDNSLLNQYGVIAINPEKYPDTNIQGANAFIEWICSDEIQDFIKNYGVEKYGESLFFPNAKK